MALLVGGSSVRGLASTTIVQILALTLLPIVIEWARPNAYALSVKLLLAAAVALVIVQLLPLGGLFAQTGPTAEAVDLPLPFAWTVAWERTAESLLFVLPPALLFLVLGRFSDDDFNRLLPFVYLGVLVNIVFALVQFAARNAEALSPGFLPYVASAGFFANQNHFATLMFVAIPLVIYQFAVIRRPLLSLVAIAIIIISSFATRSVAGAFLSLGCALISYAAIVRMPVRWRVLLLVAAVAGMVVLSFNPGNVLELRPDEPLDRTSIWRNTVQAIGAYLPFGAGFGTFDLVYPGFEAPADIRVSFINHAHNEYLELLLEGGFAAGALLLSYVGLVIHAMFRLPGSQLRWAACCGLVFMLIHSAVDYPLRTPALVLVFSVLNAVVFSRRLSASLNRYPY